MDGLYPYQKIGAAFLASRKTALLADEMGLGKTIQAIRACDMLFAEKVTVICPACVTINWRREFDRWSITRPDVGIYSYNKAGDAGVCDVLILDEAHYLKSPKAARTRTIYGAKGCTTRASNVWTLTGTPMPNNASELWTHLRALAPELIQTRSLKPMSFWQFAHKFCVLKNNGFGLQIVGSKNLELLREKMESFMLRRTKEEVLPDLPALTIDSLFVVGAVQGLGAEEEMIAKALLEDGVAGLRKVAGHVATLRRLTGLAKVKPTVDWLKLWFESDFGQKMVVFAHHRSVVEQLITAPGLQHIFGVAVTGNTSVAVRQERIDVFNEHSGPAFFVGQMQAAGVGINLTSADTMLIVEPSWVPADNEQAMMRIHRIGQDHPCLVRFVTLAGSIDEDINRALVRKARDIDLLLS